MDKKNQAGTEMSMGKNLLQKQLDAKGQDRQTVAHVVNWVSNATADLIDYFYPSDPDDPDDTLNLEWTRLSTFCRVMADMHLVMSSNRTEECKKNKLHSPFGQTSKSACLQ